MIELAIGGARSGKSGYAERQACDARLSVTYIAHHRSRRPAALRFGLPANEDEWGRLTAALEEIA